jgi:hypothetical protein
MPNTLISVEPDSGSWNGIRELFNRCDRIERVTVNGHIVDSRHCGRDSAFLVTQKGEMTGKEFTLHLCEEHAKPYLERLKE